MEDIDLDQVVEVPDTPDRLASRHNIRRDSVGNPDLLDEKYVNVPRIRGRFASEDGHTRRLVIRHPRNFRNLDINSCSNSNVDNSSDSNNSRIFRRAAVSKSSSHEANQSTRTETMDKGKAMSIKVSSKSSPCNENTKVLDLTKQSDTPSPMKVFRHGELEDPVAEDKRKGKVVSVGSSSANCIPSHSERSRNALKGKEKLDDSAFKGLGLAVALGKGVDSGADPQHKMGQEQPVPLHSGTLARVSGQKRLVRNGCISPHNIARAKQLAEQHNNSSKHFEQSHVGNVDSNGSPSVIDISDIVAEENNIERVEGKGKGVAIHSLTPKENNARSVGTSGSGHLNDNKQPNRINGLGSNVNGGWRTTRNRSRQMEYILPDSAELHRRFNGVGTINHSQNRLERRDTRNRGNHRTEGDFVEDLIAAQTSSGPVSELDRISGPRHAAKTVSKRQKKRELNLENHAESSTLVSGDPDIVILGSSEASENSKSSRIQRPQFQGTSSQVIEVDELLPAEGHSVPRGIDSMDDDSDARARQLEADEILARELQEQLYHEVPITGGGERIDENLAWALQQQEENALNTSSRGSHNLSHRRGSTILQYDRQARPESFQNHSSRRGGQARAPYSRMAQLRTRFRNQSPRVSTRGRNLQFPFDMALDMRMDILEALEAAVEDFSDVGLDSRMLRVQRDFNDNDYEMLLALDENNHQHAGATVHQINNLPQSTVQSDASAEDCAICLETPTIGETVRHLPCLHRFHKDCIDPWLGRRTSCPVCKCSIT